MSTVKEYKTIIYFPTALIISAILVRVFVFDSFTVVGNSMVPTIKEGDHVFVNKLAYFNHPPAKNDIVVGNFRDLEGVKAVKRVVALPGEWISLENGSLKTSADRNIEGEEVAAIDQSRIAEETPVGGFTYKLDPYEYFLSGDNELSSIDSFELGPVDIYRIDGKVLGIFRISELKYIDL